VPQMQELAQETSGPIIAVRCPALPIRHSVSDLPPTSGKAALTTLRPLMGNAVPQSLCLSSVARQMAACAPAASRRSGRSRIRASSQSRAWHGEGAALLLVLRPLGHRRSTGVLCDDAVWTWTVGPKGFECRQSDGSHSSGLAITPACGMYEVLSRLGCERSAPSAGQSRCAPPEIWRSPPPDDSPRPHTVA
jgi:hypothetical protein